MDKKQLLASLHETLATIKVQMHTIDESINEVSDCIHSDEFIPDTLIEKVHQEFNQLMSSYINCREKYLELTENSFSFETIGEFENALADEAERINSLDKVYKAKVFLKLKSSNENVMATLEKYKTILTEVLQKNNQEELETGLAPFYQFMCAMEESDMAKKVGLVPSLAPIFGNDLIAHALFTGDVFIDDGEEAPLVSTVDDSIVTEPVQGKDSFNLEPNTKDEPDKDVEVSSKEEPAQSVPVVETTEDTISNEAQTDELDKNDEKNNEYVIALKANNCFIPIDYDYGKVVRRSNAQKEIKSVGTKEFNNDITGSGIASTVAGVVRVIYDFGFVSESFIIHILDDSFNANNIRRAITYLYDKGYVCEYVSDKYGRCYAASKRGIKVLGKEGIKRNLKVKGESFNGHDDTFVESDTLSILTRITYSQLLTELYCASSIESSSIAYGFSKNEFHRSMLINHKEDALTALSAFYCDTDDKYYLQDNLDNALKDTALCIFAGLNKSIALSLRDALAAIDTRVLTPKYVIYSLEDGAFFDDAGKSISASDVWEIYNTITNKEEVITETAEVTSQEETAQCESVVSNDESTTDVVEPAEVTVEPITCDEVPVELSFDDKVLETAYQMIIDGKAYCALPYLKVNREASPKINKLYKELAYALNDPEWNISYSSEKVYDAFFSDEGTYNNYFVTAAALRAFFYNHTEFDYSMNELYDTGLRNNPIVSDNTFISQLLYNLQQYKESNRKGVDTYARYRMGSNAASASRNTQIRQDAKNIRDKMTESKSNSNHKAIENTKKMIWDASGDMMQCISATINGERDAETLDFIKNFVTDNFIGPDKPFDAINISDDMVNEYINGFWNKSGERKKSNNLVGIYRAKINNNVTEAVRILCAWVKYASALNANKDSGYEAFIKIEKKLNEQTEGAIKSLQCPANALVAEQAGVIVLKNTLEELRDRLSGAYEEGQDKYYYIDFLKNDLVLLDDNYFPILEKDYDGIAGLSDTDRLIAHSNSPLKSFADRLAEIFVDGGDDYGSAKLIEEYLKAIDNPIDLSNYNLAESIRFAQRNCEADKNDFVGTLELMQSKGQIDNPVEDKKEKYIQIVLAAYDRTLESKNFGFLRKVTKGIIQQIEKDSSIRESYFRTQLEAVRKNGVIEDGSLLANKLNRIEKEINDKNYTVAEDLLSRINEDDDYFELFEIDYLKEFLDEVRYQDLFGKVKDTGKSLKDIFKPRGTARDDKGAKTLLEKWPKAGAKPSIDNIRLFFDALGFNIKDVQLRRDSSKRDIFLLQCKRPLNGRKLNYKHPIAAFGSQAINDGFRVVYLPGKNDASTLLEIIKSVGDAKNTIVLLDSALDLPSRRRLARKIKSLPFNKVFGVIDRVLLAFLIENYKQEYINQMLMQLIMPFAAYQPYSPDSAFDMPPEIFMGRDEELKKIENARGVNIVYGGRQLGKSALLRMAKAEINRNENGDRAVLVDIKGRDYKAAAKEVGYALWEEGVLQKDPKTEDWGELAKAIRSRLLEEEKKIPYLLLLLDEADAFIESCKSIDYRPFDDLKSVQNVGAERFKFVIAGLRDIVRFNREAALGNNSVITHLEPMTVKPFKVTEARQLLEVPLYYLGFRFPKEQDSLVSMIFAQANYFPGLIQLYCQKLIEAMKNDYAGYAENVTPPYVVMDDHIKKVLGDKGFQQQVREKFEITLALDDDRYYYIIALLMSLLYYENGYESGYSAKQIHDAGEGLYISLISSMPLEKLEALMEEMCELNVFRKTSPNGDEYLYNRFSFHQMMGSKTDIEDKLLTFMEDIDG